MSGPSSAGVLPVPDARAPAGYSTYFVLAAVSFVLAAALRHLLDHNEADVLVAALHARDPSFIPGDWYLDLPVPYRDLYNVVAGSLAKTIGILPAAVVGRLVGIACVSAALAALFLRLRVHPALVAPLLVLYQRYRSVVAEEWIVGSFETKTLRTRPSRRPAARAPAPVGRGGRAHGPRRQLPRPRRHVRGRHARARLALEPPRPGRGRADGRPPGLAYPRRMAAPPGRGPRRGDAGPRLDRAHVRGRLRRRPPRRGRDLRPVARHTTPPAALGHAGVDPRGGLSLVLAAPLGRTTTQFPRVRAGVGVRGRGAAGVASGRVDLLKVYWFRFPDAIAIGAWPARSSRSACRGRGGRAS
jgi:hypothetical protein